MSNYEDEDEQESDPELEKEFEVLVKNVHEQIQVHVDAAEEALSKACELADKHGVSFYSSISFLGQSYIASLPDKFSNLNKDTVTDITGAWSEYNEEGWQHSSVC